jgi:N-acetyl sugar amidotransferase
MPETRPRISFDENGVCNACQWALKKKKIDWKRRQTYFKQLCRKFSYKCIVPWSGGKDSIYVAYKMREFNMEPLLVTVIPHLETDIGKWNRQNTCKDFEHLEIELDEAKYRLLAKKYFIEQGRPKHPWECAISAVIINKAVELSIPFIVYGEDGEQEYGGDESDKWMYPVSKEYLMKYYWQDNCDWNVPDDKNFEKLFFTQWSKFENWQPSKHAEFAIEKGMRIPSYNIGTFTRTSQLSDKLQDLHTYLMYIKFGFGRCTADVCISIRNGELAREDGAKYVEWFDGRYPIMYHKDYLAYFDMTDKEFWNTIRKHFAHV